MTRAFKCSLVAGCFALFLSAETAAAHHSYAMFDMTKTDTVEGTVKLFQWENPHVYLWLYRTDGQGQQSLWAIEGASPNSLSRLGWDRRSASPGEKITVQIHPLKDGRDGGFLISLTRPDGKVLSEQQ